MKIIIVIFVLCLSYYIGYKYKNSIKLQLEFFEYLKNFVSILKANLNIFKNNIVEIIDEFIKNKKAKFDEIFQKNNQIYSISNSKIKNIVKNEQDYIIVCNFFNTLGSSDYEFEKSKIEGFEKFLDLKIDEYSKNVKNKGELFFKIAISVGAVIAILIW